MFDRLGAKGLTSLPRQDFAGASSLDPVRVWLIGTSEPILHSYLLGPPSDRDPWI